MISGSANRRWYEHATRELASAGYRRGGARQRILELLDEQDCARSATEIEDALRANATGSRAVSRASVYRILDELATLGLLARLDVGDGVARYEAIRSGHGHHHHLVCDSCGRLTPFTDEQLERTLRDVCKRVALDVSEHEVVLHGACSSCAA